MIENIILVAGVLSAMASCFGSFLARQFAFRFGIVSHPNPIVPRHLEPVAYLGGLGILTGLLSLWALEIAGCVQIPSFFQIILPAALFCLLGLYDDLRALRAFPKLISQVLLALLAVALGLSIEMTSVPLLDWGFTILLIVASVNAANITDVSDGLLAGIGAAAFLAWALLSPTGDLSLVAAVAAGAVLGVLPFNLPKASMFLGDAGSHLVGFLIAAFSILMPVQDPRWLPAQLVLLGFVPYCELLFVTGVRLAKGLPWWKGSPDHFSLRLQQAGWSEWQIDTISWGVMFAAVAVGITLPGLQPAVKWPILAVFAIGYLSTVRYLLRWEVQRSA